MWLCLCWDTSENASRSRQRRYFCTAVKTPLASQANAVSLFRAQATEVLRLQQAAPRNRGKDRGVFPLRLQTSFGCSRKRGTPQEQTVQPSLGPTQPELSLIPSPRASIHHPKPASLCRKLDRFSRGKRRQELLPRARLLQPALGATAALPLRFGKLHNPYGSSFTCKLHAQPSPPSDWRLPPPGMGSHHPGGTSALTSLSTPTEIPRVPLELPQREKERPSIPL